jgi:peptidoglycan hydrolase CwlO-like protein
VVGNLINNLKDVIQHRCKIIESTRQEIKEIRNEQQTLQDQIPNLLKKDHDLRAQIETWTASRKARTWAAVVA